MSSFNVKSIQPSHLSELLEDKSHMADLERGFNGDQLVGLDNTFQVERLRGTVDKVGLSLSVAPGDSVRTSLVQTDSPTPKGNSKLEVQNYTCNEYRYAMPLNQVIYNSSDAALSELERVLRLHAGARVKVDSELDILRILDGSTGSTVTSLTGREWNAYADPDHNPVQNILDAIEATGGGKMFLGKNVANALKQSPKFTGSSAGGGVEFLTDAQLIEKIMGLGISEVVIAGFDWVNSRPLNLAPIVSRLHNNIAAIFAEGSIAKFQMEAFQYDMYEDMDTRKIYFRALETSCYESVYSESIVAFTNILV